MFVKPVDTAAAPDKTAWENYTIYADGQFYAFFGTGRKTLANPSAYPIGIDLFQSTDGVHWTVVAQDAIPVAGAHAGFGIWKLGEYFYYYPTCSTAGQNVHFKVFRTKDFQQWEHLGDEYDVAPDRAYYHERWDELYIMPDADEEGRDILYGYISSETREDVGEPGTGMLKSYDGVRWEVLPPVRVIWGDIPSQHMELNFVEKLDGRYYLSMSGRAYLDSYGYSLYTFIGESPYGPFYPDLERFRLAGTTRREVTWLGHTIRTPGGLLVALWLSHEKNEIPSRNFAIGSLKKLDCTNGHLRLKYWDGTEAARGRRLALDLSAAALAHPDAKVRTARDEAKVAEGAGAVEIHASRDGAVLMLAESFDPEKGFILEGTMCAREFRHHIASHQHGARAGFYFEVRPGSGIAMLADTLGVTRSGPLRYADHKITQRDDYAHAAAGLVGARSGLLQGTLDFLYEDTVGPFGHAAMCGIHHGRTHHFRLLARGDYFELFVDDIYVQTYLLPEHMSGKVGLCVMDGSCSFQLKAYEMTFGM